MAISVRQLHPVFAAEITGIDLRERIDPPLGVELTTALDRHAVLGHELIKGIPSAAPM